MPRLKTARKRAAKQEVVPSMARPVGELESGALSSSSDSDDSSVEGSRASLGLDDLEEGEEFQVSLKTQIVDLCLFLLMLFSGIHAPLAYVQRTLSKRQTAKYGQISNIWLFAKVR